MVSSLIVIVFKLTVHLIDFIKYAFRMRKGQSNFCLVLYTFNAPLAVKHNILYVDLDRHEEL